MAKITKIQSKIKLNDTMILDVKSAGSKGDGVAFINGLAVFIPNTEIGKSYNVKITNVCKKCAFAEVIE